MLRFRNNVILAAVLLWLCPVLSRADTKPTVPNPEMLYQRQVAPLIDKYCLKCHAGVQQKGGLDLRSLETALRGGESGSALIPGKPNESRLFQFVAPKASNHMPPDPKRQLSSEEISLLKTWIASLPAPKTKPAVGKEAHTAWVSQYMADYRKTLPKIPPPPAKLSASAAIDWFLQADWKQNKIAPAPLCSDAVFVRRVYLDIAGRIPSADELKQFVSDKEIDKRLRLVTKLLASEDYSRYQREVFDTALMGRPNSRTARERADKGWNRFLEESFRANRPWNAMVRDLLVARSTNDANKGAFWFVAERKNSYQAIAEAVAPVVFGVQVKCAQCHNHPLAWEIEQRHYWGLVAAFNRSKNVETETGTGVAESAVGGFINFANLKKESQPAALVFFNGKSVAERIPPMDEKENDSPELYQVPPTKDGKPKSPAVPKFSRREAFADSVTKDNPLLARALVNRVWAMLMGRGFVQPVDQIDSWHHTSHPELLEWLSSDFERSGYDIKNLVKTIVLSRAYQLDSKPTGKTLPLPETFARALEKPLSAEQLMRSLWIATGNKPETSAADTERIFAATFPDIMPDTYNPSLQQALFLTNSPVLDRLLKPAPGNTVAKILAIPTNEARVQEAFRIVLGRTPDAVELKQCQSLFAAGTPERSTKNLLWALLTGAEFQVNH